MRPGERELRERDVLRRRLDPAVPQCQPRQLQLLLGLGVLRRVARSGRRRSRADGSHGTRSKNTHTVPLLRSARRTLVVASSTDTAAGLVRARRVAGTTARALQIYTRAQPFAFSPLCARKACATFGAMWPGQGNKKGRVSAKVEDGSGLRQLQQCSNVRAGEPPWFRRSTASIMPPTSARAPEATCLLRSMVRVVPVRGRRRIRQKYRAVAPPAADGGSRIRATPRPPRRAAAPRYAPRRHRPRS